MKPCRECHIVKQIEDFYKSVRTRDGRMNTCKECHKAYDRDNRRLKAMARAALPSPTTESVQC